MGTLMSLKNLNSKICADVVENDVTTVGFEVFSE